MLQEQQVHGREVLQLLQQQLQAEETALDADRQRLRDQQQQQQQRHQPPVATAAAAGLASVSAAAPPPNSTLSHLPSAGGEYTLEGNKEGDTSPGGDAAAGETEATRGDTESTAATSAGQPTETSAAPAAAAATRNAAAESASSVLRRVSRRVSGETAAAADAVAAGFALLALAGQLQLLQRLPQRTATQQQQQEQQQHQQQQHQQQQYQQELQGLAAERERRDLPAALRRLCCAVWALATGEMSLLLLKGDRAVRHWTERRPLRPSASKDGKETEGDRASNDTERGPRQHMEAPKSMKHKTYNEASSHTSAVADADDADDAGSSSRKGDEIAAVAAGYAAAGPRNSSREKETRDTQPSMAGGATSSNRNNRDSSEQTEPTAADTPDRSSNSSSSSNSGSSEQSIPAAATNDDGDTPGREDASSGIKSDSDGDTQCSSSNSSSSSSRGGDSGP